MLRTTFTIVLAMFAVSEAMADSWVFVRQTPGKPFPTIHVYSDNGTKWDRVGQLEAGLEFNIDARGRCEQDANTQNGSSLVVKSGDQEVATANLAIDQGNRSFGPDHGQGWRTLNFKGNYVRPQPVTMSPAEMCNNWAATTAEAAPNPFKRRQEMLAEGFSRDVNNAYTARFTLQCKRKDSAGFEHLSFPTESTAVRAKVVCHGNPDALQVPEPAPPPARREKVEQGIQQMRVWVNPSKDANFTGFCPTKLHFGGEIDYLLPPSGNTVNLSYHYFAKIGTRVIKSERFTTVFDASGKRNLHSWALSFPIAPEGPSYQAPAPANQPDVFGGYVALEFVGAVQIHANLQPAQFKVTCIKEAKVAVPLGGTGQVAAPSKPPEIFQPEPAAKPLPDLVITVVGPSDNDSTLRVRIENRGDGPAGAFNVKLFPGRGTTPVGTSAGPIAAHGIQDILVRSRAPLTGLQEVQLRVDDPNRITEANESNNGYRYHLTNAWPKK